MDILLIILNLENNCHKIEFSEKDSPFFEINQDEVQEILKKTEQYKPIVSGWCNAYGFQIDLVFKIGGTLMKWQFIKYQQSNQDPFFPRNSKSHFQTILNLKPVSSNFEAYLGRNLFKKIGKKVVQVNFQKLYLNSNAYTKFLDFEKLMKSFKLSKFSLKNECLLIETRGRLKNPATFIECLLFLTDYKC